MAIKKTKKARLSSSKDLNDHITGEAGVKVINSSDSVDNKATVHDYDVKQGEVHSDTHLEEDTGHGKSIVIRSFIFKANPQAFKERTPSKQELFNAHAKQIEIVLWKDGLKVMPEVSPKLVLSKNRTHYRIIVGAEPAHGQIILPSDESKHQTLSQAAHGIYSGT